MQDTPLDPVFFSTVSAKVAEVALQYGNQVCSAIVCVSYSGLMQDAICVCVYF